MTHAISPELELGQVVEPVLRGGDQDLVRVLGQEGLLIVGGVVVGLHLQY